MDPIKNPFAPGAGAPPPALAGRDREIENFRVMIGRLKAGKSTKSLLLTGLRGVGKTVLLNAFRNTAESEKFITGSAEITHEIDFKAALARLARRAVLAMDPLAKLKSAAWTAAGVLKSFSIKIPGGEIDIDVAARKGSGDSGRLHEDLSDLFVAIGEAAREKKIGVAFFFDEMQFLRKEDLEALIAATHQVSQRLLPIAVVGAGLPQLPRVAGEAKSYAERLFDFPKIGRLSDEAARRALEIPAEELRVRFERPALDAIVRATDGYPYFLQEYGKHVWNIAESSPITKKDVERARLGVTAQLDENFFRVRIDRTTNMEHRYAIAMARLGTGPYQTGDVAKRFGKHSSAAAPVRGHLINKGLLFSPSYGMVDFTVPQFDDFLRRTFPEIK